MSGTQPITDIQMDLTKSVQNRPSPGPIACLSQNYEKQKKREGTVIN